jgi:DNA mismatch repair protein MutS
MAGMPQSVLERANQVLEKLEQSHSSDEISGKSKSGGKKPVHESDGYQLSFIQLNDPLLEQIRDEIISIDIDTLTPVEALMKLNGIKKLLKK